MPRKCNKTTPSFRLLPPKPINCFVCTAVINPTDSTSAQQELEKHLNLKHPGWPQRAIKRMGLRVVAGKDEVA
jgi:hypothetical protein